MSIAILGGTGPAGKALAARLASTGVRVVIGSRDAARASEEATRLRERWPERELELEGAENSTAARSCEIVVVATPWEGATPMVSALAETLERKVVVSMVNALQKVGNELQALVPPRGSMCVAIQQAAPGALVAGAFHHVPARALANLDEDPDADVLVCADSEPARVRTIELVDSIRGLRGVNGGSLSQASAIEAFTAVLVNVNIAHRVHSSIRLTGLGGH